MAAIGGWVLVAVGLALRFERGNAVLAAVTLGATLVLATSLAISPWLGP